jgi:hypothetical protein
MYLRIFSAVILFTLGACSTGNSGEDKQSKQETVPCAFGDAKKFTDKCPVERSSAEGKNFATIWHPDGGFRRLEVIDGGKGYSAADGADVVEGGPNGREVEVMIGDDHYLMPGAQSGALPDTANAAKR